MDLSILVFMVYGNSNWNTSVGNNLPSLQISILYLHMSAFCLLCVLSFAITTKWILLKCTIAHVMNCCVVLCVTISWYLLFRSTTSCTNFVVHWTPAWLMFNTTIYTFALWFLSDSFCVVVCFLLLLLILLYLLSVLRCPRPTRYLFTSHFISFLNCI